MLLYLILQEEGEMPWKKEIPANITTSGIGTMHFSAYQVPHMLLTFFENPKNKLFYGKAKASYFFNYLDCPQGMSCWSCGIRSRCDTTHTYCTVTAKVPTHGKCQGILSGRKSALGSWRSRLHQRLHFQLAPSSMSRTLLLQRSP